ncbi:succinate dehydrogenase flavoprotein subunit [Candidatus Riesia pediculischaeffi]|uniref:Succinate dehydrogenase flavoprotein subunit n=2 Tax=Candidatus Riesia pediculischaeffi TaxID=428411 RepID=A0A1V0HKK6_9ENTR|nr:succinate dehydrogenase flavoprotein subunit [Candidatus Riesia pediculischaeffi]ARC53359.1 succinate dehydrogenase [Candidatus Riesia pediculischaeffi]KIE63843.1 Succinate dehydrogenase flavoprotein subunit [Candidatus Riesia pediculischaeffi PTSU]
MKFSKKMFDVIIIGAGGSGMRAALEISKSGLSCAVITKVFPIRSHTISAQGGIAASLGNVHEDKWIWHMYDTVKGSDYLSDQNAVEHMCKNGPDAVLELEDMGVPFSRLKNGKIYQRSFGGQTKNFGQEKAFRIASAEDRTGHAILHTLFQQNIKNKTVFYSEWYAIDLIKNQDDDVVGCISMNIHDGEIVYFCARSTILATGGAGRVYYPTTNSHINTGDGIGMVIRAGLPVQDMEMWQFHPTGIADVGILITEGCRGEGGYLINNMKEKFMYRYAPIMKDLASRDIVSRSILKEIQENRGFLNSSGKGFHVKLRIKHLNLTKLENKLPGILELSKIFAHVNPKESDIPVVPTCHYMMGGIPCNVFGQAITMDNSGKDKIIPGLFVVGEVSCTSVHGANRLGGNSLLDLIVFGKTVGISVKKFIKERINFRSARKSDMEIVFDRLNKWNRKKINFYEDPTDLRDDIQRCMTDHFYVFREEKSMTVGLKKLEEIREKLNRARLKDHTNCFNTHRVECLEIDNLMETAIATAHSAIFRKESRGAHYRTDYPKRNDQDWLFHTLYFSENKIKKRRINVQTKFCKPFLPKERNY